MLAGNLLGAGDKLFWGPKYVLHYTGEKDGPESAIFLIWGSPYNI